MLKLTKAAIICCVAISITSCVSTKKYSALQKDLDSANRDLGNCGKNLNDNMHLLSVCEKEREKLRVDIKTAEDNLALRQEQFSDMRKQLEDTKSQRDNQVSQVGNLTVLSQSANDNIKETLAQLEKKDKYIYLLQKAKTKADSINLALAINLKGVLMQGLDDQDIDVKIEKTLVMINLSDKMLFKSGSDIVTPRANEVLGKIAKIVESRNDIEVLVEGYTDNVPIKNTCMDDNWDLSVKRSTSVVRILQHNFKVNPNRLIAAGRGEYNTLASNATSEGRATNRRTRIIIMPKLDQFYDLLNPDKVPK